MEAAGRVETWEERKDAPIWKRGCFVHVEVEGTWQRTQWPLFPLPCTLDLHMYKTRKFRSKPLSALPLLRWSSTIIYVLVMNEYNK